jgi:hypothetical protein
MRTLVRIMFFFLIGQSMSPALSAEPVQVDNGPTPSQTIRYWHLKEEWRAGPEGEDFVFGFIVDVTCDAMGNTYLLDFQQQETYVFGPAGKFLHVRGHKGEGPGETTMASNLLVGADRLGLVNRYPLGIVWLDNDGDPAGKTTPFIKDNPEAILGCWYGRWRHDSLLLGMTRSTFTEEGIISEEMLVGCAADGTIGPVYLDLEDAYFKGSLDGKVDEGRYYNPFAGRWDLDEKGRIWIAPERDHYVLQAMDSSGRIVLETTREFINPDRTDSETGQIRASIEKKWAESGLPIVVGDKAPCIEKLWIMENPWGTEIWIESAASHHDLPPEVMVRYDLFNLDGKFTHQVDIVGKGDPSFDRWYLVGNNRLIMVRNASAGGYEEDAPDHPRSDDDALEVISYGIVWEE